VLGEDPDLEDETDFRPKTVYAYDAAGRVTQETTNNNNLPRNTLFKYNAQSLPTEVTDAAGGAAILLYPSKGLR
jgi:YD repeat-containing protein